MGAAAHPFRLLGRDAAKSRRGTDRKEIALDRRKLRGAELALGYAAVGAMAGLAVAALGYGLVARSRRP